LTFDFTKLNRVSDAKGVLIYKKQFKGETMMCVRGNGVVPIPPEEVISYSVNTLLTSDM
jgi:hypothetical protein